MGSTRREAGETFYDANNAEYRSNYKVQLQWSDKKKATRYSEWFSVIDTSPYPIVVGIQFIVRERVPIAEGQVKELVSLPLRRNPRSKSQLQYCIDVQVY